MRDKGLNILIVDDELNAREFLQKLMVRNFASRCGNIETAHDIQSAKDFLLERTYDVVFLDIQLGKENGFDLLKQFATRDFEVVFTTAYKEFALNAIKESAFDYILKPINYIDILSVFKKIEKQNWKKK